MDTIFFTQVYTLHFILKYNTPIFGEIPVKF